MLFNILLAVASTILFIDVVVSLILINRKEVFCLTRVISDKRDLLLICRREDEAIKHLHRLNELGLVTKGVAYEIERKVIE